MNSIWIPWHLELKFFELFGPLALTKGWKKGKKKKKNMYLLLPIFSELCFCKLFIQKLEMKLQNLDCNLYFLELEHQGLKG